MTIPIDIFCLIDTLLYNASREEAPRCTRERRREALDIINSSMIKGK